MGFGKWFDAVLMGIVEGLTEFIPVSSTGHLIVLGELIGFRGPPGKTFEIVIQLGAVAAVCWHFRARILAMIAGLGRDGPDRRFAINVVVALVPALVIGGAGYSLVKLIQTPLVVGIALVVGALAIFWIERNAPAPRHDAPDAIPMRTAFLIGLCQTVAMIPGISRSGATIMGALLLGVERRAATEFSFFLLAPTMVAAAVFSLWKNRNEIVLDDLALIAVGFLAAFVSALFVVRGLVAFIGRHGFAPFAWYRLALGGVLLAALALR
ncbi:MAG: undecaprenyl-diphosphate phosphatase [Alphaproteobacteria bacterium]|nr:undecaprenyl-diphosphate phosphatase [Alphaproteobacteria bacterium]